MESFNWALQLANDTGWLSFISLLIGLVAFGITLSNVVGGRRAATRAEEAASIAVGEIKSIRAATDLSSAISELEGVRRLLKENSLDQLSERLAAVRKLLIGIGTKSDFMEENDRDKLRLAVSNFADIEKQIDRHNRGKAPLKPEEINDQLIDQIDGLVEVISGLA